MLDDNQNSSNLMVKYYDLNSAGYELSDARLNVRNGKFPISMQFASPVNFVRLLVYGLLENALVFVFRWKSPWWLPSIRGGKNSLLRGEKGRHKISPTVCRGSGSLHTPCSPESEYSKVLQSVPARGTLSNTSLDFWGVHFRY
eukprot:scaffold163861_cov63-Cyclotella_meneghiniana.AAC.1